MITVAQVNDSLVHNYDIRPVRIQYMGCSANLVFKVFCQKGAYSLRIHQSLNGAFQQEWGRRTYLESEMIWLAALKEQGEIPVPGPVRNNKGGYVTKMDGNGSLYTLLSWVEGTHIGQIHTKEKADAFGTMAGKLHRFSAGWTPPAGFDRPIYNKERTMQALKAVMEARKKGAISQRAATEITAAGEGAALYVEGTDIHMIHGDLTPRNYVFHNGQAGAIDFGCCGFGSFLHDLGWAFSYVLPGFRERVLAAYTDFCSLPPNAVKQLECFYILGRLESIRFWLGLPDNAWVFSHLEDFAAAEISWLNQGRPFLYDSAAYSPVHFQQE